MAEKDIEFGKRLDRYIFDAGLSKSKLAEMVDVSPSAIGAYINEGRIPEAPILLKIAQSLNVSMEVLLTGEVEAKRGYIPHAVGHQEVAETSPIYNESDAVVAEILDLLKSEPPEVQKICLRILKNRKELKAGLQSLAGMDNLLKEEG